jgi:hypothetical protein
METCIYLNTSKVYKPLIINIPNLPNSSTPKAANMKKRRKNRRPRLPTCGKACITVSKKNYNSGLYDSYQLPLAPG